MLMVLNCLEQKGGATNSCGGVGNAGHAASAVSTTTARGGARVATSAVTGGAVTSSGTVAGGAVRGSRDCAEDGQSNN